MNEPTEVQLGLAPWYTQNASDRARLGLGVQTGGPLPYPAARALVLFEFFDATFNDLGETYRAAFPLRGLV